VQNSSLFLNESRDFETRFNEGFAIVTSSFRRSRAIAGHSRKESNAAFALVDQPTGWCGIARCAELDAAEETAEER